jgi:hypothetical protein
VAVIKQADPKLQPRLAGADDQKASQCPAPLCSWRNRSSDTGSVRQLA